METIKEVLMRRDSLSSNEADELIEVAKAELESCLEIGDMESAEDTCMNFFGLEPDYLMELM